MLVILSMLFLTGVVASLDSTKNMLGQLLAQEVVEPTVAAPEEVATEEAPAEEIAPETAEATPDPAPVTNLERSERFEQIVTRTREQYAVLHALIAEDIERDLEEQLHGSAPTHEQLKTLREQRWREHNAVLPFVLAEFARWFGLSR